MARRRTTATLVAISALALLALGACHDDRGDDAGKASTSTSTTAGPASGSSSSTTSLPQSATTAPTGCPGTKGRVPSGVASRAMGDVDGDGKPDTLYVFSGETGVRHFGVVTAAGYKSEWTTANASPVDPSILGVVDADQDGHAEVFVNPGRLVNVLTFAHCRLQPYLNREGKPYELSIGFGAVGTGVGCVDADGDGRRDLVGLQGDPQENSTVTWSRTIIRLSPSGSAPQARNGATSTGTYTSPADDAQIALLHEVTCGDETFAHPLVANPL
jgi:hypothetical protein